MATSPVESTLDPALDELWRDRDALDPADPAPLAAVTAALAALDEGTARVAGVGPDGAVWVDERAKRAILLAFRLLPMTASVAGPFRYEDRVPLKSRFDGVRVVPGAIARWGSYIAPGAVLMPSYVNIGARVGAGTLVDTWATVGSCAQVGERVHLSGGVGLGGVLEPVGAVPVVVEDDALVGSRALVVEGARVGRGAVLGAGAVLTASMPVIDAQTGAELSRGHVPPYCVAVAGTRSRELPGGTFGLPCLLVLRRLEPGERHDKTALNELLRDHGAAS